MTDLRGTENKDSRDQAAVDCSCDEFSNTSENDDDEEEYKESSMNHVT